MSCLNSPESIYDHQDASCGKQRVVFLGEPMPTYNVDQVLTEAALRELNRKKKADDRHIPRCADCRERFTPGVDGATYLLCGSCYRNDCEGENGTIMGSLSE